MKKRRNAKKDGLVYVGIPRERFYIPSFVDVRDAILTNLSAAGIACGYYQAEGHRVDRNRDRIVREFLNHQDHPEWLYMIDSDMEHPPDSPIMLIKHKKPIVGGLYFHRGESHDPFVFVEAGTMKDEYGRDILQWRPLRDEVFAFLDQHSLPMRDGSIAIDNPLRDPLIECDAVATGNIVIHRSVLEKMPAPHFEYRKFGTSEDLMFCYEAKRAGFPIYADLSVISGHYSMIPTGQAQFRMLFQNRGINLTSYSKRTAIGWLSKYLKIDEKKAKKMIEQGNAHMVGAIWDEVFKGRTPTSEEIDAFYDREDVGLAYLIELLHWNFLPEFARIRSIIVPLRSKNVIEIGSGIGSVAMQLAIQGNNVLAVEPNNILRGFAEMRWNELNSELVSSRGSIVWASRGWMPEVADSVSDAIVTFDTLEHLSLDELRVTIRESARMLKPSGRMIFHNNWEQQDIYPMHQKHEEEFNELLNEYGFLRLSPTEAVKK